MHPYSRIFRTATAAVALATTIGCGFGGPGSPETAVVTGTVTLDGQPVEGALLIFTPIAGGRQSGGTTDAEGHYELTFSRDQPGALPGEHRIEISTLVETDPDSGTASVPEKLPAKYNVATELTRTVEADDNVIDFELDSAGKIMTPYVQQ